MKAYQKRRIIYSIGLVAALYVIFSLLVGAHWIFQVFLFLNDRTITLDGNRDDEPDYWEYWENGNLVQSQWDLNYDGRVDFINKFQNNEVWELLQDADFDGYFEYRERWVDGRYISEIDENKDGVFAEIKVDDDDFKEANSDKAAGGAME